MINLLIILHIYFVSFLDKPEKNIPALSPRAVEQRAKWNIPTDERDYPVSPLYQSELIKLGVKIHHTSRWFNGVTCEMNETQAAQVAQLSFVTEVEMTRQDGSQLSVISRQKRMNELTNERVNEPELYTDGQLKLYNLLPLHDAGYKGQGILMTVCDGGFQNANTMSCFRPAQELGHFDFTDDDDDFYGSTGAHGTECLSTISGIVENEYYGSAPEANYYLMRSEEYATESPKEMDNLVAALEKADSLGVNVFSVSLGYGWFDNSEWDLDNKKDLDGKTTRASQAATIAARKGMLVCVAAGNEGTANWRTIGVPADADSVLTVGAVDRDGVIGNFSSYGPSSDGRIKPEVCAVGVNTALMSPYGFAIYSNGTSFATPLIAGLAASLWSALPNETAMQIRERIIRSSNRYRHPDIRQYHYGYGIPDAWQAYTMPDPMEGIENLHPSEVSYQKVLRGDQILIVRYGHVYNLAGQRVE